MTGPGAIGPAGRADAADSAEQAKLRKAARDLEGIFTAQLLRAMRESVPASPDAGPGQEMFQGMLDDTLAAKAAERSVNGLGDALYRQLSRKLAGGAE